MKFECKTLDHLKKKFEKQKKNKKWLEKQGKYGPCHWTMES
jgi:hypothetical protein